MFKLLYVLVFIYKKIMKIFLYFFIFMLNLINYCFYINVKVDGIILCKFMLIMCNCKYFNNKLEYWLYS